MDEDFKVMSLRTLTPSTDLNNSHVVGGKVDGAKRNTVPLCPVIIYNGANKMW